MFDAVVFAGGGNRCYWQGGFYEAAAPRLGLSPKLVVGASAGAFAAIYSLLGVGAEVRALVYSGAGPHALSCVFGGGGVGGAVRPLSFPGAGPNRKIWGGGGGGGGEPLCPVGP